jgi:hypothetical protein
MNDEISRSLDRLIVPDTEEGTVEAAMPSRRPECSPVGQLRGARSALGSCRKGRVRASAVPTVTTVQRNHRSPSLRLCSWDDARGGDSDCGHEGPGWLRRAADGQQPVFVTTGEPASKSWRIMTADSAIDRH